MYFQFFFSRVFTFHAEEKVDSVRKANRVKKPLAFLRICIFSSGQSPLDIVHVHDEYCLNRQTN